MEVLGLCRLVCLRIEILFVQNRAVARVVEGRQPLPVCAGLLLADSDIVCAKPCGCLGCRGRHPLQVCAVLLFADSMR